MLENFLVNDYKFKNEIDLNHKLVYLDYIDKNYEFNIVTIQPGLGYKYQGNLFAMFKELGIDTKLYLYTMYINGYTSPIEFKGDKLVFKIPIEPPIPIS